MFTISRNYFEFLGATAYLEHRDWSKTRRREPLNALRKPDLARSAQNDAELLEVLVEDHLKSLTGSSCVKSAKVSKCSKKANSGKRVTCKK
uniref:Uncharacterized protein n=1 Tax=Glossina austeni TaxID=7395 RepID=A0A1A9VFG6_GLOAU